MSDSGLVVGSRIGPPLEGILADFSIDSAVLKSNHKRWLDLHVRSKIERGGGAKWGTLPWRIHLYGLASKSGSDQHNLTLSQRRAESVRDYVLQMNPGARLEVLIFPRGESYANSWQGALDRAVHLQMWQAGSGKEVPRPPSIDIPPEPSKESPWLEPGPQQQFELRTEDFVTGSIGVLGRLQMWMLLQDTLRKKHCYYQFSGSSVGISVGTPVDLNKSDPFSSEVGPWNAFSAQGFKSMPLTTDDFGGPASYIKTALGNRFRFGMSAGGSLAYIPHFQSPDDGLSTVDVATTVHGTMTPLSEELPITEFRSYSGRIYG